MELLLKRISLGVLFGLILTMIIMLVLIIFECRGDFVSCLSFEYFKEFFSGEVPLPVGYLIVVISVALGISLAVDLTKPKR